MPLFRMRRIARACLDRSAFDRNIKEGDAAIQAAFDRIAEQTRFTNLPTAGHVVWADGREYTLAEFVEEYP